VAGLLVRCQLRSEGAEGRGLVDAGNTMPLTGKVAVVTGGSSDIGAATARRLASAGARIVVGYNKGEGRATALVGELDSDGHRALRIPMEDSGQIRSVASTVSDEFRRAPIG
jgi:3-oxoacyl-[acyl-carrier protein] reductase